MGHGVPRVASSSATDPVKAFQQTYVTPDISNMVSNHGSFARSSVHDIAYGQGSKGTSGTAGFTRANFF